MKVTVELGAELMSSKVEGVFSDVAEADSVSVLKVLYERKALVGVINRAGDSDVT